ncbi:hypothetical protein BKA70DRAFT_1216024 [Coprinopsis sp. MPI-PUGE-AT-0042]|nr:hypothetical protein BKA70DRAFT_1216024 [Coprinopsis sp. MPI-PUGE-AT-0042]
MGLDGFGRDPKSHDHPMTIFGLVTAQKELGKGAHNLRCSANSCLVGPVAILSDIVSWLRADLAADRVSPGLGFDRLSLRYLNLAIGTKYTWAVQTDGSKEWVPSALWTVVGGHSRGAEPAQTRKELRNLERSCMATPLAKNLRARLPNAFLTALVVNFLLGSEQSSLAPEDSPQASEDLRYLVGRCVGWPSNCARSDDSPFTPDRCKSYPAFIEAFVLVPFGAKFPIDPHLGYVFKKFRVILHGFSILGSALLLGFFQWSPWTLDKRSFYIQDL